MRVIRDKFTEMAPDDYRFRSVRAALVIAECSKSAINNVVNFVVIEGESEWTPLLSGGKRGVGGVRLCCLEGRWALLPTLGSVAWKGVRLCCLEMR